MPPDIAATQPSIATPSRRNAFLPRYIDARLHRHAAFSPHSTQYDERSPRHGLPLRRHRSEAVRQRLDPRRIGRISVQYIQGLRRYQVTRRDIVSSCTIVAFSRDGLSRESCKVARDESFTERSCAMFRRDEMPPGRVTRDFSILQQRKGEVAPLSGYLFRVIAGLRLCGGC